MSTAAVKTVKLYEDLILSLLRLPQVVRLHQPNNKIYIDNLQAFRDSLQLLWQMTPSLNIRIHRGRIYVNETRLSSTKNLAVAVTKLTEILEARQIFGFRFCKADNFTDEDIVQFFQDLVQSRSMPSPGDWLASRLEGKWVSPIQDSDFKISIVLSTDGTGKAKPIIWNAGIRTLALKAKKSYSRALAVLTNLNDKISVGENVNVSKPRRVVQDMVEGLFQNENLLLSLSTIRDYDDYTCTHSVNVAILSMCLGKRLGLSKIQIMVLGLSALFHDLGKVDIPIDLIRKTSKFTPEEYDEVKKHPLHSVLRILRINSDHALKSKLLVSPYEHHLGIDLGGYPSFERATPLTLYGRIVAIADHYDALTSSRSYRPVPISPEQALNIMLGIAGSQLDPLLLKVFVNMIGIYPIGTLVLLDSQEVAMVMETPSGAEQGRPNCVLLEFVDNNLESREVIDLSEKGDDGRFRRNILRCFHPSEFGLNPSDILLE
ncbi:MAG: HD domain-containing protein [Deltaproteobacteria bacterium]|jgi:HD-GYP domain-containing protein (c-di-GMP phosphodiesterase class II)|nr:HD domain-containing protein [Deltaproteobacteria bacterium]